MERWHEVSTEQLEQMYGTLSLIETVCSDNKPELYFYGITSNDAALEAAQESLQSRFDEEEEAEERKSVVKPTEIAIAIPFSSDVLYYLLRGLKISGETFAYMAPGEGARTDDFLSGSGVYQFKLTDRDFTHMALINDDESWLDDFLTKHGTKAEAPKPPVERTEPAKAAPKVPAPSANNSIDNFLNA